MQMGTPYEKVVEKLTSFGKKVGEFNQGDFQNRAGVPDSYVPPGGSENIAGGFCEGVNLDWIRRMLLGLKGHAGDAALKYITYGKPASEATVKRMAFAYSKQKGDYGSAVTELKQELERLCLEPPTFSVTLKGVNMKFTHG